MDFIYYVLQMTSIYNSCGYAFCVAQKTVLCMIIAGVVGRLCVLKGAELGIGMYK